MLITEFYKNKELFITGGTGYLGKNFLEKLLRDCPEVSKVYLFIRKKRNKTPLERLKELSDDILFERLHREQPNAFEKVIPIVGDSSELGLGISPDDLQRLKNVNIIVHGAANVKFDTDLCTAILMNTRGTYELVKLALTLKNLLAFIHVSTAYIYPFKSYIKEEMYEAPVYWRTAIKIAETFDEHTIECLKLKYTEYPNAYSFTKNLCEQVVAEFSDKLPVTILRPSIVSHALYEPEPGYIGNLNGYMGLLVTIGLGISQVTNCNKDLNMALIPVDTVTILTIIAAYRRSLETINGKKNGLDVFNLTAGKMYKLTISQSADIFLRYVHEEPFAKTLWAPSDSITSSYFLFLMCIFLINIPMAAVYDTLLVLSKRERMVMKITRKIVSATNAIGEFSQKYFDFQNDGMMELAAIVSEKEKEKFNVGYLFDHLDMENVVKSLGYGVKKYVLKEPVTATPASKRRLKMFIIADKLLKIFIFLTVTMFLWKMVN